MPGVRTVILVLNEDLANVVLSPEKNAEFATYEMMQVDDHVAVEVTSALVVRKSFLSDAEFAETYLPVALGFEPAVEFTRPAEEPIPMDN